MNRRTAPLPFRRRRERGAAAVETAFSIVILAFVMTAGIQFGDAMVVRHRLTSAVNRAARICSVAGGANAAACVGPQLNQAVQDIQNRCQPLNVTEAVENVGAGVQALRVRLDCSYAGGVWSGLVKRYVPGGAMLLSAQAMMPIQ
jgi:Flp pilus assembly protein TadG